MQEYVSVPMAEKLAGVPQRTIRNWIKGGKLAAIKGERGYTVRVQDVRAVAVVAGRDAVGSALAAPSAPTQAGELAVRDLEIERAARVIEEAMRPLVEEIGDLREQLGRERARREALEQELAALDAEDVHEGVSWWRRLFGGSAGSR